MLQQLKQHLQKHRITSLYDLVNTLQCEPDVVRDMLQRWIDKGKVSKCIRTPACGQACFKCDPMRTEMYQWVLAERPLADGECAIYVDDIARR